MKKIDIRPLPEHLDTLGETSRYLDTLNKNRIDQAPWKEYPYIPSTSFSAAYTKRSIALKYYVSEKSIKSTNIYPNRPVHEDSCVEFFIAFNNEAEYYNIEFNCTGTCSAGFGAERNTRRKISEENIATIRHETLIRPSSLQNENIYWELAVIIPVSVFQFHAISDLKNTTCKVNFYKCGDKLPEPHFLAWSNIDHPLPNFHLPEYFGYGYFE